MPSDYHPNSPVYDPTFKQNPLSHCSPKEKLVLDPDYHPQNYVPNEEGEDTTLLIDDLVSIPKNAPKEDKGEKSKEEERKEEEEEEEEGKKRLDKDTGRLRTRCRQGRRQILKIQVLISIY